MPAVEYRSADQYDALRLIPMIGNLNSEAENSKAEIKEQTDMGRWVNGFRVDGAGKKNG